MNKKVVKKALLLVVLASAILLTFTGCVPGDGTSTAAKPAGFFWGIWHGWIAPVSLILSLFRKHVGIYEIYNTGWWYNFGFYIAVISGFGGLSLVRRKSSDKHDK